MRRLQRVLGLALIGLISVASLVSAQQGASIRGKVVDESGLALPGVAVTATSPALLVPQLATVTDTEGSYAFQDLPIGVYRVTYELTGFQRFVRDGVQLTAGFAATLNVEMKIGALAESITVSGESPVVDSTSTTNRVSLSAKFLTEVIPATHTLNEFVDTAPGVVPNGKPDLGGGTNNSGSYSAYGIAGQLTNLIEGINTRQGTTAGGNGPDVSSAEELQVTAVAGGAEQALPGVFTSLIVKSGGNQFHGRANFQGTNKDLQSDNKPASLAAQGVAVGDAILSGLEWTGDLGGRLIPDKFWFYAAGRFERANRTIVGYSQAPGPDGKYGTADDVPGTRLSHLTNQTLKLTYQATSKYKIVGFATRNGEHLSTLNGSRTIPMEASQENIWNPNQFKIEVQGTPSNRLVIKAFLGLQDYIAQLLAQKGFDNVPTTLDNTTLINTGPNVDAVRRPRQSYQPDVTVSYFAGKHSIKAGYSLYRQLAGTRYLNGRHGNYRLIFDTINGVAHQPFQIQTYNNPVSPTNRNNEWGMYAQDSWQAPGRLTFNLGVRLDGFHEFVPAQTRPAGQFSGVAVSFPAFDTGKWHQIAPRLGMSFDVTGDGKTVVKAAGGRYNHAPGDDFSDMYNQNTRVTTTYKWHDLNSDGDYQPGEVNLDTNGPDFVSIAGPTNNRLTPGLKDPHTTEYTVSLERELMPNFGGRVAYVYIRQHDLFDVVNALIPYSAYNVVIPRQDPGPDGTLGTADDGSIVNVYDFDPALKGSAFVANQRVNRDASRDPRRNTFEAVLTRRSIGKWGLLGSITAQKINRYIVGTPISPNDDYFNTDKTWDWNSKISGNYELPMQINFSGTVALYNGVRRQRTYLFRSIPSAGTVTLRMEPYGTSSSPARTLLSLRFSKNLAVGPHGQRVNLGLDILNALNSNSVWSISDASGPTYGQISTFTTPRLLKGGITYSF